MWNQKIKQEITTFLSLEDKWDIITELTGHRPNWRVMGESWGASAGEGQRTLLSPGVSCLLQSAVRWNGSTASQLIAAHQLIIATSDWTNERPSTAFLNDSSASALWWCVERRHKNETLPRPLQLGNMYCTLRHNNRILAKKRFRLALNGVEIP